MTKNKIFYLAVLPALFIQALSSVLYFVVLEDGVWASVAYFMVKFIMLMWPISVAIWLFKKEFPKFNKKKDHKSSLLWGAAIGVVVGIFIFISYHLFLKNILLGSIVSIRSKVELFGLGSYFLIFAFILSVFNAAFEEYYWRWFVFRGLTLKLDWKIAMLLSSLAFALHHFVVLTEIFNIFIALYLGVMVMVGGCLMAFVYRKSNSILGAWFLHFLIDIIIMLLVYQVL